MGTGKFWPHHHRRNEMSRKLGLLSSWLLFCLMAAPLKADELAAGRARVQQYL